MRMRFAVWRLMRALALAAALLAPVAAPSGVPGVPPAVAQEIDDNDAAAIVSAKSALDRVEAELADRSLSVAELGDLRTTLTSARESLQNVLSRIEPRLAEAQERLKQLGPPPAKDAPPEAPALAAERAAMTQNMAALDAAAKQSRLLLVRSEQLAENIVTRRHARYAREVLVRTPSVLDPGFWRDAGKALPDEFARLSDIGAAWTTAVREVGWLRAAAALLGLAILFAAAASVRRWWGYRYANGGPPATRLAKARIGLWVFFSVAVLAPAVSLGALALLHLAGLWTAQANELAAGLIVGIVVGAFGRGAARGLFAPERPQRRLVTLNDAAATCLTWHITWGARALGATIVLQVAHKTTVAPLVLTVATNALFAIAVGALIVHLIHCLRRIEDSQEAGGGTAVPWVRPLGWILVAVLAGALATGYVGLAAFVALRAVVGVALVCALYLLLVAIDALFVDSLSAGAPRGRAVAAHLGIAPRSAALIGTLLSAAVRVTLVVMAAALIIGPWQASTADLLETAQSVPLGFRIGEINISLRSLVSAIAVLLVMLAMTRIAQRWLQARLLPLSALEPSLQLSIATIFGYVGAITGIALSLGALGIDLQKIALVAGALSVGIGFGLQSIVSNFVSGLILLAERPIRVGDSIVVKGEEGWVRRIRVRATEIETFERASVIIPNSELITGLVKNWTHTNTLGRVIIKVRVSYASDPEKVRDLLERVAAAHPQIIKSPPPHAYLLGLGDNALEFDLRCVVANVDQGLSVRSDLHIAILKAFREAGIAIPVPPIAAEPRPTMPADAT